MHEASEFTLDDGTPESEEDEDGDGDEDEDRADAQWEPRRGNDDHEEEEETDVEDSELKARLGLGKPVTRREGREGLRDGLGRDIFRGHRLTVHPVRTCVPGVVRWS